MSLTREVVEHLRRTLPMLLDPQYEHSKDNNVAAINALCDTALASLAPSAEGCPFALPVSIVDSMISSNHRDIEDAAGEPIMDNVWASDAKWLAAAINERGKMQRTIAELRENKHLLGELLAAHAEQERTIAELREEVFRVCDSHKVMMNLVEDERDELIVQVAMFRSRAESAKSTLAKVREIVDDPAIYDIEARAIIAALLKEKP